jgi:hypothetical protein
MRAKLSIGADGQVILPRREAEALGLAGGGDADLVTARGAFALVTPARGEAPGAWFAGSLAALSVAEVVQFVATSLKTGVLLLAFGREAGAAGAPDRPELLRRRSIYFRDGQVVYASSSDPADRLGPVLAAAGLLSEADLERCRPLVGAGRALGQVLVDEGILTAGQVYEGMTLQVREILLGAFVETSGTFAFLEGSGELQVVRLRERTRDLLLEGMHRVEEAETLARELGGREAVLAPASRVRRPSSPAEARLLPVLDGSRTVAEAGLSVGLGTLAALRAAVALLRAGAVTRPLPLPAPPPEDEVPVEVEPTRAAPPPLVRATGPFEAYRRMLRRVHGALAAAHPAADARLDSYFERLPAKQRAIFDGVRFGPDGELDVQRVLANVTATGAFPGAASRARALEALEDLFAFALFEVKNCLPQPEADALLREVGRMRVGKA